MPEIQNTSVREYSLEADGVCITLIKGLVSLYHGQKEHSFHAHSNYELFFAQRGRVELHFEADSCILNPGQGAIVPPGERHYAVFTDPEDRKMAVAYMLQYREGTPTAGLLQTLHRGEGWFYLPLNPRAKTLLSFFAHALWAEEQELCGMYLLAALLECACTKTPKESLVKNGTDSAAGRLYKIEQTLFVNHTEEVSLRRLAEELHLSPRQLSRFIQKHYGVSYREKILQIRMESAARRLKRGEDVASVSAAEGYRSLSAFYTAFRKTFGMTPADYKRVNAGLEEAPLHPESTFR